jgi:hypothetical protein
MIHHLVADGLDVLAVRGGRAGQKLPLPPPQDANFVAHVLHAVGRSEHTNALRHLIQ